MPESYERLFHETGLGMFMLSFSTPDLHAHSRPAARTRGGRPDLAGDALPRVQAPTLLIVGGADDVVIELNRAAMRHMRAHVELQIVPGATHLFEEPGTLEQVSRLALAWCLRYLSTGQP